MRNKFLAKGLALCMIATTSMAIAGCGTNDNTVVNSNNTAESSEQVTSATNSNDEQSATVESTTINTDNNSQYMTTEAFYTVNEISDKYELTMEYMPDDDSQFAGTLYGKKTFEGSYAISSDDVVSILVADYGSGNTSYIEIAGVKKEFSASPIEKVGIIDIDEDDSYKEVVVYDLGPSSDPTLTIFRYCDGEIHKIGSFDSGLGDYNSILFDKNGKIIEGDGYIDFVEPQIVTEYYEVTDNDAKLNKSDYSTTLNQTYKLTKNLVVSFCETDDINIEDYPSFNLEETIELKAGEEITLFEIGSSNFVYYIQLPDGRKGAITTQLAG